MSNNEKCKKCGELYTVCQWEHDGIKAGDSLYCLCPKCAKELSQKCSKLFRDRKSLELEMEQYVRDKYLPKEKMGDFTQAGKIKDWEKWIDDLPKQKGVYAVIYRGNGKPEFVEVGTGGHFRGRNPNVPIKTLHEKWKTNYVLYIGRANKDKDENDSTIFDRVKLYMRFGNGKAVGHWGGRYIWQIKGCGELEIHYMACDNPQAKESELIQKYQPFANLKEGDI